MMIVNRRRYMGEKKIILPSGYKEIECISNIQGAYIDTGYIATHGCKIIGAITPIRNNGVINCAVGSITSNRPPDYERNMFSITDTALDLQKGGIFDQGHSITAEEKKYNYEVDTSGSRYYMKVNGVLYEDRNDTPLLNSISTVKFGFSDFSQVVRYQKTHRTHIYSDTGVLVRDFVPAERLSDNKVGMYELVNGSFYVSANGINFIAG